MPRTLVLATALFSGCILVVGEDDLPRNRQNQSAQIDIDFPEGLTDLVVDVPAGDLNVVVGTELGIRATLGWRGDLEDEPQLAERFEAGQATFDWTCRPNSNCTVDLFITIPADLRSTTVLVDAGDVDTNDLSGTLDIAVDAGDVDVRGHAGNLSIEVDAGAITALDVVADEVMASTNAGGLEVAIVERPTDVVVSTDVGNLLLRVPEGAYAVETSVDVGNLTLGPAITDDSGADARINARVDVGNLEIRGI